MLKVTNLTKKFSGGYGEVIAVDNLSFSVKEGQFASIVGKSGSGKSTLLAMLGALERPSSGSIEVAGNDVTRLSDAALTKYRGKQIGFVFQNYNLVPNLTALENVMVPMEFAGKPVAYRKKRAKELLERVGFDEPMQKRKPGRLSGGEQQRVAIARALANKPSLLLADEPTGNLDTYTGEMIFEFLHEVAKEDRMTIIAVTHDLSIAGKTDMTFRLQDGKLIK